MMGIKFDEEMVKKYIDVYHDQHGKYPYLIMSEKTRDIVPDDSKLLVTTNYYTITTSGTAPSSKSTEAIPYTKKAWNSAKILIDNDLEFGEVHIG